MATNTTTPAPTSPFTKAFSANADEFYSQLYVSVPIGIALVVVYIVIRKLWPYKVEVRRQDLQSEYVDVSEEEEDAPKRPVPYPNISLTGNIQWILDIWQLDNNAVYHYGGYDAVVLIIMLRGFTQICLASMPYALVVLLPIYATSEDVQKYHDWLDILSLNTIGTASNRLYATTVGAYVFSLITLYFLSNIYLKVAMVTDRYFVGSKYFTNNMSIDHVSWFNFNASWFSHHGPNNDIDHLNLNINGNPNGNGNVNIGMNPDDEKFDGKKGMDLVVPIIDSDPPIDPLQLAPSIERVPSIEKYSVMIRDLPVHLRNGSKLKELLHAMYGGEVSKVVVIPDVAELIFIEKRIKYHESKLKKIAKKHNLRFDDLYNHNNNDNHNENVPDIRGRTECCGLCGESVNLITYHKEWYNSLITSFNQHQETELSPTPTAFVTFNNLKTATTFVQSTRSLEMIQCKVTMAPRPKDILWQNLPLHSNQLIERKVCINISMVMLLIFWSIPVVAIASLANLTQLVAAFGGDINKIFYKSTIDWLSGSLSVLVLDLWLSSVPIIMDIFSKILRPPTRSQLELSILSKYYVCLIFMVLLVTVISSAVLNGAQNYKDYFKNFAEHIGNIADLLGKGLSNLSIYFLLYLLLNAFIWIPMELFRPSYFWYKLIRAEEANRFYYSVWIPKILLIFTILLTYSVMNPIMWIFGFIYFMAAMFVLKYHLVMSWVPVFEIGPQMWVLVFELIRYGFVISIVTLYGLILLKQSYICSVLLLPLLVFVWNKMAKTKAIFKRVFESAALISAQRTDLKVGKEHDAENEKDAYLPPVMFSKYRQNESYYQLQN